jgi:hypothetical protein
MKGKREWAWSAWLGLLTVLWLVAGCGLCKKHLPLYRDTETKSLPTSEMALLITDPGLVEAVSPGAKGLTEGGYPWMAEQSVHETEAYRLSLDRVDGKPVYQGMCLDTTPTYSLEVRPGDRRLHTRVDLYGPGGQEKLSEVATVNLDTGGAYFVRPDWEALKDRHLVLKVQRLPEPYSDQLRSRVADWNRGHDRTRQLAD